MVSQADFDDLKTKFDAFKKKGSGKVPTMDLPTYEGRADEKTFREFLDKFYLIGNLYGWDPARCCQIIPTCLRGEALAVYQTLPNATKAEWDLLTEELAAKLITGDDDVQQQQALNRRFQRLNESVAEFGLAIKALVKRAFPTSRQIGTAKPYTEEFRSHQAVNHFLAGLKPNIKEHLLRGTRPVSLEAAISAAITEEQTQRALREDYIRNESAIAVVRLEANNEELKSQVADLRQKFEQVACIQNVRPFGTHRNSFAQREVDPRKRSWRPKPNRDRSSTFESPNQQHTDHGQDNFYLQEPASDTASSPGFQRRSSFQTNAILPVFAVLTLLVNIASANNFVVHKAHRNCSILDHAHNDIKGTPASKHPPPDAICSYEMIVHIILLSVAVGGRINLTPCWMPFVQGLRTSRSQRISVSHWMSVLTTLLTVSMIATSAAAPQLTGSGSPCRPSKPNLQNTRPPKATIPFFSSPTSWTRATSSRSPEATTTPADTTSFDAKLLSVASQPQANFTTINCQCQADSVQVLLLLSVVIGMPTAMYMCIAAIRSAKHHRYTRSNAKITTFGIAVTAAEAIFDAETTEAAFAEAAEADAAPDAAAADTVTLFDAAEVAFAAEIASVAEAPGIRLTTTECSPNECDREALNVDETAFENAITARPNTVSEPPRSFRRSSKAEATTSNLNGYYHRPPSRNTRWTTSRGRPNCRFFRAQRAETHHPKRKRFARFQPYPGRQPTTPRQFGYGRPRAAFSNTQTRAQQHTQTRMSGQSRPFSSTRFAVISVITIACAITACHATDPAAAPTPSAFAGASKTVLALIILLFGTLGTTSQNSVHDETPPTEVGYADVGQIYTPQNDWRIISGPPAEYDLSLDVPLPTPSPPQSPSPPPRFPPPSLPAALLPPSTSDIPDATSSTPYFASVLSRYPADTMIFVIFSVYVIVFETTTSSPSWIRAASRYAKTRLTNAVRDASRSQQAVIIINPDLPANVAVSVGRHLRQLNSVAELLLPNNPSFLLQANAFALISLHSAFPAAVRTATFAADRIKFAERQATAEEKLLTALQAVFSSPLLKGYSDADVATSLSRRAPSPEKPAPGNPSRFNT